MTDAPLTGRLLVAVPAMADPNFAHAVVFILEHNDDGALGIVLNRPSEVPVPDVLPAWQPLTADPGVVFVGGPVQPEAMVGLGRVGEDSGAVQPILPSVGVVDLGADPLSVSASVPAVRLFVGYAGWDAGQLEGEVAAGGWFVIDAAPEDVFTSDPERLWGTVLRRQGGIFRTISANPSQN